MLKPIGPIADLGPGRPAAPAASQPDASFRKALDQEVRRSDEVRLSAHARERLESRNIELTERHHQRLDEAVSRADEKGANQSLVLLDDLALVVSVRNRVVITALDENKARSGVFTNIDSAVIA